MHSHPIIYIASIVLGFTVSVKSMAEQKPYFYTLNTELVSALDLYERPSILASKKALDKATIVTYSGELQDGFYQVVTGDHQTGFVWHEVITPLTETGKSDAYTLELLRSKMRAN